MLCMLTSYHYILATTPSMFIIILFVITVSTSIHKRRLYTGGGERITYIYTIKQLINLVLKLLVISVSSCKHHTDPKEC